VIGVLRDFNYESLRKEVGPLVLEYSKKGSYVVAQINTAATAEFVQGFAYRALLP